MVDDLVYDVGLHRGEDSAYYLAKGYRVRGFEANPDLVAECRARFADDDRITLVPGAIADTTDPTARFYVHPFSVWGTTNEAMVERNRVIAESELLEVPTVDFAESLSETGMPYFMKVDIEGADMLCVRALGEFDEAPRYLSIESTKTDWEGLRAELTALEGLGYTRFTAIQQEDIPGTEIRTETIDGQLLKYRFEADASGPFGPDLDEWTDRAGVEEQYRSIFRSYRRWGDGAPVRRYKLGRLLNLAAKRWGPLPGWFDTHAARD
jgi:FkbM family methyltransferase